MLNDLRHILEEDNKIENDLELMMEGTDSDMIDMFIDDDGEAEIPESELNKILTKIPEYNREEELNKRLKRLTESVIPDCDDIVMESKESRDAKFAERMEKMYKQQASSINTVEELEVILKKNKALYKQISNAIKNKESKLDDKKIKRLLVEIKDRALFMKYDPGNPSENTPLSILKRNLLNNKICEKVIKERIKELKANKESYEFDDDIDIFEESYEFDDDIDIVEESHHDSIVEESEYVCDMTDIEDLF